MPKDPKYGEIKTEKTPGNPFGDDEVVVLFRSRDAHLPAVLDFYAAICSGSVSEIRNAIDRLKDYGIPANQSPPDHILSIMNAKGDVERWQRENAELVKVPD